MEFHRVEHFPGRVLAQLLHLPVWHQLILPHLLRTTSFFTCYVDGLGFSSHLSENQNNPGCARRSFSLSAATIPQMATMMHTTVLALVMIAMAQSAMAASYVGCFPAASFSGAATPTASVEACEKTCAAARMPLVGMVSVRCPRHINPFYTWCYLTVHADDILPSLCFLRVLHR